jgi:hypothetical protein
MISDIKKVDGVSILMEYNARSFSGAVKAIEDAKDVIKVRYKESTDKLILDYDDFKNFKEFSRPLLVKESENSIIALATLSDDGDLWDLIDTEEILEDMLSFQSSLNKSDWQDYDPEESDHPSKEYMANYHIQLIFDQEDGEVEMNTYTGFSCYMDDCRGHFGNAMITPFDTRDDIEEYANHILDEVCENVDWDYAMVLTHSP